MALPDPLKIRPSMSSDTGVFRMSPANTISAASLNPHKQTRKLADSVLCVNTRCALEDLDDSLAAVNLQNLSTADGAVSKAQVDDLRETRELYIVENHKGAVDGADRAVLCRCMRHQFDYEKAMTHRCGAVRGSCGEQQRRVLLKGWQAPQP
jgi:hypothetical protein